MASLAFSWSDWWDVTLMTWQPQYSPEIGHAPGLDLPTDLTALWNSEQKMFSYHHRLHDDLFNSVLHTLADAFPRACVRDRSGLFIGTEWFNVLLTDAGGLPFLCLRDPCIPDSRGTMNTLERLHAFIGLWVKGGGQWSVRVYILKEFENDRADLQEKKCRVGTFILFDFWQRKLINPKWEAYDLPFNVPRNKSLHVNIFFYSRNVWMILDYYDVRGPSYLVLQWGQRKTISGPETS